MFDKMVNSETFAEATQAGHGSILPSLASRQGTATVRCVIRFVPNFAPDEQGTSHWNSKPRSVLASVVFCH